MIKKALFKIIFKIIFILFLLFLMFYLGQKIYLVLNNRTNNEIVNDNFNELKEGKYILHSYTKEKAIFIRQLDNQYVSIDLTNDIYDKIENLDNKKNPLVLIDNKIYGINSHYTTIEDFKTNNDTSWIINYKNKNINKEDTYIYSKLFYKNSVIELSHDIGKYDLENGYNTKYFNIHNNTDYTITYELYEFKDYLFK